MDVVLAGALGAVGSSPDGALVVSRVALRLSESAEVHVTLGRSTEVPHRVDSLPSRTPDDRRTQRSARWSE